MKRTIQVVSLVDLTAGQVETLKGAARGVAVRLHPLRAGEDVTPHVRDAEVILSSQLPFDPAQAPHLAWVQAVSAGINQLLEHPLWQRGIRLTTASGIHAVPIAEHVLAMMLAWARRLPVAWRCQAAREWGMSCVDSFHISELRGATLGIVGYGSIGRHLARLASQLGLRILAVKRTPIREEVGGWGEPGVGDPAGEIPERIYGPGDWYEMLPQCDFVVTSVPLTPATRHLIGSRELAAMKRSAFLINIARGEVVDEEALIRALREGTIAGAGLDVFANEPLPADSPLYGMDNVILTPHVAGHSARYYDRLALLFAENLARYADGRPLLNLVDRERGY